ncbi:MAG: S26 family signal peptidase, partial [Bacteroidota bacterium]
YAIENECNIAEMIDGVIYINGKKAASYEFGDEYCFVAGDNHALSYDSRDFGFLPEGAILGKAVFKIRSAD